MKKAFIPLILTIILYSSFSVALAKQENLNLYAFTEKDTYPIGSDVSIHVILQNIGKKEITLKFDNYLVFDFEVIGINTSYHFIYSKNITVVQAIKVIKLNPGEWYKETLIWKAESAGNFKIITYLSIDHSLNYTFYLKILPSKIKLELEKNELWEGETQKIKIELNIEETKEYEKAKLDLILKGVQTGYHEEANYEISMKEIDEKEITYNTKPLKPDLYLFVASIKFPDGLGLEETLNFTVFPKQKPIHNLVLRTNLNFDIEKPLIFIYMILNKNITFIDTIYFKNISYRFYFKITDKPIDLNIDIEEGTYVAMVLAFEKKSLEDLKIKGDILANLFTKYSNKTLLAGYKEINLFNDTSSTLTLQRKDSFDKKVLTMSIYYKGLTPALNSSVYILDILSLTIFKLKGNFLQLNISRFPSIVLAYSIGDANSSSKYGSPVYYAGIKLLSANQTSLIMNLDKIYYQVPENLGYFSAPTFVNEKAISVITAYQTVNIVKLINYTYTVTTIQIQSLYIAPVTQLSKQIEGLLVTVIISIIITFAISLYLKIRSKD